MFFSLSRSALACVSFQNEFPPSIIISFAFSKVCMVSIVISTGLPAGTMNQTIFLSGSLLTRSSSDLDGFAPSSAAFETASLLKSKTTISCPSFINL